MSKYGKIVLETKDDLKKIPNAFIGLLTVKHLGKTVLTFKAKRGEVVLSRELLKMLKKIDVNFENIIFLSSEFTVESRQILDEMKIEYVSLSNFSWTDESYINIKKWELTYYLFVVGINGEVERQRPYLKEAKIIM